MKITDRLFHAHLHCKTKCYLLSRGEVGLRSEYQQWRDAERQTYTETAVAFCAETISATIETNSRFRDGDESLHGKRAIVADVAVSTELLECTVQALDLRHQKTSPALPHIAALHFHTTNKLTRNDKLMAAFDGIVLSERFGKRFVEAAIVHGDGYARTRANSPPMLTEAKKLIEELASVVSAADPPKLILNRHCAECEFQARCQQHAVETDELSLLPGMTEKERKKLHAKGIFTVTQLSYTYRPRRRSKHGKSRPEKYHHSLKASSLRLGKIHIVGELDLKILGTPVYLDVEGLPNSDFYYLIGLQCHTDRGVTQKSHWADDRKDEHRIWNAFLKELSEIDAPSILHYGGYEKAFFKRMIDRYGFPAGTPHLIQRAVQESFNVLSALYGKVYFPTLKNGLKQVAGFLGARWKHQDARGTDSIMWRTQWERSREAATKDRLMNYNQDDCEALHLLVTTLQRLIAGPKSQLTDISFPDDPKKLGTERADAIHRSFDGLLKSAHSDYKAAKVSIRGAEPDSKRLKRPLFKRKWPKTPGHQVTVPRKRKCPNHPDVILKATRQMASCRVLDLVFTKSGCRKTIIHYVGKKAFCPDCQTAYVPPAIKRLKHIVFGRGWQVWGVYQRMVLRTSYRLISQAALDFFGEVVAAQNIQFPTLRK